MREVLSFCRICCGTCGTVVSIDDDDRLVHVRGDRENELTMGYVCGKGVDAPALHNSPKRILRPLKRQPDGTFTQISLEQATAEIAEKLRLLIERHGPAAIASYIGTAGFYNPTMMKMLAPFMRAIGSPSKFTTLTIDCSAAVVTAVRLGTWGAGRQRWDGADVWMLFGCNPLVSITSVAGLPPFNTMQRLKAAKARGLELIIVDPRRSETAVFADEFVQIRPGEDIAFIGGMLRIIFDEGLYDRDFCAQYVEGLDRLKVAVAVFTPTYVARRCAVSEQQLFAVTRMFAGPGKRGCAIGATGISFSPLSNLADHMVELLNVVCGRFTRSGERVSNPVPNEPPREIYAEVIRLPRWWEEGHKLRNGLGMLYTGEGGELPTAAMPDEILNPGPGQIKCLLSVGGNPASAIPDQAKTVRAFEALELLVAVEPFLTTTARLAHYVIPTTLMYERPDVPMVVWQDFRVPMPFAQYTPALVPPPKGSDVTQEWRFFWDLAARLGKQIELCGRALDMKTAPTTDQILDIITAGARVPLDEIRRHPRGAVFPHTQFVQPAHPDAMAHFDLLPDDVAAELEQASQQRRPQGAFTHLMTSRRMRGVHNSVGPIAPRPKQRGRYNPAYLHPTDMAALGIVTGDRIEITSDTGQIIAIAEADDSLLPGVLSMAHSRGGLPGEDTDISATGVCTALLISTDRDCQPINAMPRMSAVPVRIAAVR
jgi:anaerobic selenocysteine-containing dehydrogenase